MSDSPDFNESFLPLRRFALSTKSSPGTVRRKIDAGLLHAVKDGKIVKVAETPSQYLSSLPAYQPGSRAMPAGPGRGHRTQAA